MKRFSSHHIKGLLLPIYVGGRGLLFLILFCLSVVVSAQIRFGYVRYDEISRQMPMYAQAQKEIAELKVKYEKEATRSEEEFQRKFSDFLQGQKDFPANILQKRQAELQDVMERGIAFRQEAQALLSKAEATMMEDVYRQLNAAISAVAQLYGFAFVLNTDGNSTPYINPDMGEDITDLVRVRLGIIKANEMTIPAPLLPSVRQTGTPAAPVSSDSPAVQISDTPSPVNDDEPVIPVGENVSTSTEGENGVPTSDEAVPEE